MIPELLHYAATVKLHKLPGLAPYYSHGFETLIKRKSGGAGAEWQGAARKYASNPISGNARMAKLADVPDLGSDGEIHRSSSPLLGMNEDRIVGIRPSGALSIVTNWLQNFPAGL